DAAERRGELGLAAGHLVAQPQHLLAQVLDLAGGRVAELLDLLLHVEERAALLEGLGPQLRPGAVVLEHQVDQARVAAAVEDRPRRQVAGVVTEVAEHPEAGEQLGPALGRPNVDVGGLVPVGRRRGEQDLVAGLGQVADRGGGVGGVEVLDDLDAGHQVVAPLDRLGERADPHVGADRGGRALDGVLGHVEPVRLDPALAQRGHEEALRAADVEDGLGLQLGHDRVRDTAEELRPVLVLFVRHGVRIVVPPSVELSGMLRGGLCGGVAAGRGRGREVGHGCGVYRSPAGRPAALTVPRPATIMPGRCQRPPPRRRPRPGPGRPTSGASPASASSCSTGTAPTTSAAASTRSAPSTGPPTGSTSSSSTTRRPTAATPSPSATRGSGWCATTATPASSPTTSPCATSPGSTTSVWSTPTRSSSRAGCGRWSPPSSPTRASARCRRACSSPTASSRSRSNRRPSGPAGPTPESWASWSAAPGSTASTAGATRRSSRAPGASSTDGTAAPSSGRAAGRRSGCRSATGPACPSGSSSSSPPRRPRRWSCGRAASSGRSRWAGRRPSTRCRPPASPSTSSTTSAPSSSRAATAPTAATSSRTPASTTRPPRCSPGAAAACCCGPSTWPTSASSTSGSSSTTRTPTCRGGGAAGAGATATCRTPGCATSTPPQRGRARRPSSTTSSATGCSCWSRTRRPAWRRTPSGATC